MNAPEAKRATREELLQQLRSAIEAAGMVYTSDEAEIELSIDCGLEKRIAMYRVFAGRRPVGAA